jgi:histidyl-tRNA synthetase
MQNKKLPYKRFQIGYVFRDEPTTGNRLRQFTQNDIDIIGSSVKEEAEILFVTFKILQELGIKAVINFNNRKLMNEVLEKEGIRDEKIKKEVIKEIDKLDKIEEREIINNLKKYKAEKILEIFKKPEKYFEKYENYREIKELKMACLLYGIKINFQPTLARGLSYYNSSVFEVKTEEMKESVCGGGSYIFNNIQCSGISFGLERLSQLTKINIKNNSCLIISLDQDKKSIELASKLRETGTSITLMFGKPSKALEYANSYNINYVLFVGEDEVKKKKFKIRNMKTGKEQFLSTEELKRFKFD